MKKKLCATASFFVLGALLMSPLHAMEIEENKSIKLNANKASTIHNRSQRDHYLEQGLDLNAAPFAIKVINEDPGDPAASEDPAASAASHNEDGTIEDLAASMNFNEDATIEDFRSARDIFSRLAIKDPDNYLAKATTYAEVLTGFREVTLQDYIIVRNLCLKQGDIKSAAYWDSKLPEKIPLVELKDSFYNEYYPL